LPDPPGILSCFRECGGPAAHLPESGEEPTSPSDLRINKKSESMKKMRITFLLVISGLILHSCSKSSNDGTDNNPGNNPGTTSGGACSGNPGSLFTSVKTVLATNCALSGCHAGASPQNGLNFSDNCTIVAQSARIKARAVDHVPSQMPPPPAAPLSDGDKKKITDWIAAGGRLSD
jgi:uncharacterized membrane protein